MYPYFYYFYYDDYIRGAAPPPMPPFITPPGGGFSPAGSPPTTPPPSVPPTKPIKSGPDVKAIDPNSIRFCRYRFTYIWPSRGNPFWMWIVYIGRRSISGWRWTGRNWAYAGIDLNRVDSFKCY
ncbi:hypothetical protein AL709_14140 [Clostridium botulinum]|uniref:hypothetical protein n=1 Tax=Clostridium botulinum TaxID=1491 RepID=UPI00099DAB97|nr:hypothetical protein [Clostridium botulinum]OPD20997.1 hypothetical protein AL709_14140 [Clostridium botulinum]